MVHLRGDHLVSATLGTVCRQLYPACLAVVSPRRIRAVCPRMEENPFLPVSCRDRCTWLGPRGRSHVAIRRE